VFVGRFSSYRKTVGNLASRQHAFRPVFHQFAIDFQGFGGGSRILSHEIGRREVADDDP